MGWYRLDLLYVGAGELVEDSWKLAWAVTQSGDETDCSSAIFQRCVAGDRPTLFFTPAAHDLAETFGAVPCERPSPTDMTLVAGDERAWQVHFGRVFAERATAAFEDTHPSGLADLTHGSPLQ